MEQSLRAILQFNFFPKDTLTCQTTVLLIHARPTLSTEPQPHTQNLLELKCSKDLGHSYSIMD